MHKIAGTGTNTIDTSLFNTGTIRVDGGALNFYGDVTNSSMMDAFLGTINVTGSYAQAGGALSMSIYDPMRYGSINFSNPLAMVGNLSMFWAGPGTPQIGQSFKLITYPSETGTFKTVAYPSGMHWRLVYGGTAATLNFVPAPPPPTNVRIITNNSPAK